MVNYVVALGKKVDIDCSTSKITATACNDRAISLTFKIVAWKTEIRSATACSQLPPAE